MRILLAPDKFKGSLTSEEAARAIEQGVRTTLPSATTESVVVADGGDGMLDVALANGGTLQTTTVQDPLGDPAEAQWAVVDGVAVIEMARASGLQMIRATARTSLVADTFGTGQLILAALDHDVREIVVGVGGAASTDGGSGALRALGLKILKKNGHPVRPGGEALLEAVSMDKSGLDLRLRHVRLRLATDVRNPLLGESGAAQVYAPQKGAGAPEVERLETALRSWATLLRRAIFADVATVPGAGAAGGFPSGFLALTKATIESGFDVAATLSDFDTKLQRSDLVIVGEGSLDAQSLQGKVPVAVASRARALGIPVLAVAGRVMVGETELTDAGIDGVVSLTDLAADEHEAMTQARSLVERGAEQLVRRWVLESIGRRSTIV